MTTAAKQGSGPFSWLSRDSRAGKMRMAEYGFLFSVSDERISIIHHSSFIIHHSSLITRRRRSRRGLSLLEVLIAVFVLAVGLLALAMLIPAGQFTLVETGKADRSGACGRAGLSEVKIRRMLDYELWSVATGVPPWWPAVLNPRVPPPNVPVLESFVIDPLGVARGSPANLGPIWRIRLLSSGTGNPMTEVEADSIFTWSDELLFDHPDDVEQRPRRLFRDINGQVGGLPQLPSEPPLDQTEPLEALTDANYSWFVTVTPAAAEVAMSVAAKTLYSVSVVVCYKRDFSADGEISTTAQFLDGMGYGGGSVILDGLTDVREDEWVMLSGEVVDNRFSPPERNVVKWYRVLSAGRVRVNQTGDLDPAGDSEVTTLTLAGPDWTIDNDPTTPELDAQLVVVRGVVGVYTKTVELNRNLVWTK